MDTIPLQKMVAHRNLVKNRIEKLEAELKKARSTHRALDVTVKIHSQRTRDEAQRVFDTMSEVERLEFYVCKRKPVFILREQAVAVRYDPALQTYQCVFCSGFHNGHKPRKKGATPRPSSILHAMVNIIAKAPHEPR